LSRGLLVAGTHGRGAWNLDTGTVAPALVATTADSGVPAGPGTTIDYTITVKNEGNADATGVTVTQPLPPHTTFAGAQDGGTKDGSNVTWTVDVPAGGATSVHYTATIDPGLTGVSEIVSVGLTATDGSVSTSGSPFSTPIAPAHAVSVSPQTRVLSGAEGSGVQYQFTVTNDGYLSDGYDLQATGDYATSLYQSDCTTPVTATGTLQRGDSAALCAVVSIPASVPAGSRGAETITATSQADSSVGAAADIVTVPASSHTLLVDEDGSKPGGGAPDAQDAYVSALTSAGHTPDVWDLTNDGRLTQAFLDAHTSVYWETGVSYPSPLAPYESMLQPYLDAGNSLFVSGQDILDQSGGTTDFVANYLHITWDGSERQNDKATATVTGIAGTPIGGGLGSIALNQPASYGQFEDEITPNNGAQAQFQDTSAQPDGLAVTDSTTGPHTFKVVFLAYPLENLGTASDRAAVIGRVAAYFGG
jgi:uncharacterized repeat protein (TIGR01451 family)